MEYDYDEFEVSQAGSSADLSEGVSSVHRLHISVYTIEANKYRD